MMKAPFSEGQILKRLNTPETYMIAATLLWTIANTPFITSLNRMFAEAVGGAQRAGFLGYCSGILVLSYLLGRSIRLENRTKLPQTIQRIVGAFGAFSLLFLGDVLLTTKEPFPFAEASGSLWVLTPFFMIVLFLNRTASNRIVMLIVVSLGIQAVYSAFVYCIERHQHTASNFGNQISRTGYDGNACASLFLMGAPLCLAVAMSVRHHRLLRLYCLFAFAACETVLVLNDWRSAWIGAAVCIVYWLASRLSPLSSLVLWKKAGICAVVALITGVVCVQARGDFSRANDAPTSLGSSQISLVGQGSMASRVLLGSGYSTHYGYDRPSDREENSQAGGFRLLQIDPESLYVRLVYDFGLVGLFLFLYLVWACARYESDLADTGTLNPADRWLISGIHAELLTLLVAGLTGAPLFQENRFGATFLAALLLGVSVSLGRNVLPVHEGVFSRFLSRYGKRLIYVGGSLLLMMVLWQVTAAALLIRSVMPKASKYIGKVRNAPSPHPGNEFPVRLQDAAVAAEDLHFYQHHGIDWGSLHRALRRDLRAAHVVQGGSTITMQVARYLFLSEQKTASRKLAELYLADYLEKRLTKAQILRLYLQTVDFGMHSPGVNRAAITFFGKSPNQLTLGEAAYLVGNLPEPPANPREAGADSAEERRLSVLARMETCFPGKYSAEEMEAASNEKPVFVWQRTQKQKQEEGNR